MRIVLAGVEIWLVVVLYKVIVVIIHFRKGIGGKMTSNSKRLLKKMACQMRFDTWILGYFEMTF